MIAFAVIVNGKLCCGDDGLCLYSYPDRARNRANQWEQDMNKAFVRANAGRPPAVKVEQVSIHRRKQP